MLLKNKPTMAVSRASDPASLGRISVLQGLETGSGALYGHLNSVLESLKPSLRLHCDFTCPQVEAAGSPTRVIPL